MKNFFENFFGKKPQPNNGKPVAKCAESKPPAVVSNTGELKPGDFIAGEYRVRRVFGGEGKSGMGVVYLVEARTSEEPFVLKTFQSKRADGASIARFKAEAETWINLGKHANIVQCHWVREFSEQLFVAAEFICTDSAGRNTLTHYIESGSLSLRQQLHWIAHFCFGMKHAMAHGLRAHRDVKPDNLMIDTRGHLKITDFGLAKGLSPSEQTASLQVTEAGNETLSLAGSAFGTPQFMAPEQFVDSSAVDHRADIYSLGIVIYLMISGGRLPIVPNGASGWALAHHRQCVARLDHPLMNCAEKCLEKDRRNRFQTYDEILDAISEVCRKHSVPIPTDEQDARAEFLRQWGTAMSLVNVDRPEEAIPKLREMEARWPESPEVYNELYRAYWKLGNFEEALAATQKALELDSYSTADWNNLGGLLAILGRVSEAKDAFLRAIRIEPENTGAMIGLAQLLMAGGELKDAKQWCEFALFWRPEKVTVLQIASDCYSLCGETAKAVQLLERILGEKPDDAIAWLKKGNAMSALGKHEDAIACHDKAIAYASRTKEVWKFRGGSTKEIIGAIPAEMVEVKAWNGRGLALKALGRHLEAVASYEAALKIDPEKSDVWCNKGNSFHAANRHADALECFDKAVALDSRDMKSWCNRGVALKALGRLDEAVKSYDKALELDPRDAKTWFNKANALAEREKYKEAMACFQEAKDLGDPNASRYVEQCRSLLQPDADGSVTTATSANDAQELYDKAADLASSGRHAEAVVCYESGLRLDPSNPHIWFNMAHSIGHLGRHQDVVKSCDRALKIHPNFSALWILKGLGFLSMDQFDDAMACFKKAKELGDTSAADRMAQCRVAQGEWYFRLGSRYQQEGNHTEANACYEKGLARNPNKGVIWVNKGAALMALSRAKDAVVCFDRAIALDSNDSGAWNNKGIALMSLGQREEGAACLLKALKMRKGEQDP